MGREFELKYRASEAILEAIREKYPQLRPIAMETHYYDTPDGALSGRKWMLRRRLENGVSVCTLKTPLPGGRNPVIPSQCAHWRGNPQKQKGIATPGCGLVRNDTNLMTLLPGGARGEWEVRWEDITTAPEELCKLGAPAELIPLTADGLVEVCGARFTRLAGTIELPGGQAELALDRGVLTGGGREIPLFEVEVEHKQGSEETTVAFAEKIASEFGLEPEAKSKFHRAFDLR